MSRHQPARRLARLPRPGLCFELLPESVRLDDWGYPVVDDDLPAELVAQAREAVRACPTLALRLVSRD